MMIESIVNVQLFEDYGTYYPLDKKYREYCGLVLNPENCQANLTIDDRRYTLGPGACVFYREGERYRIDLPTNHIKCYVINFLADDPDEFFVLRDCGDLTETFAQAYKLWMRRREDEFYRYDCMAILYRLLAELNRRCERTQTPYRKKGRLDPVLEILHSEYTDPNLRISELPARVGLGERYVNRLFAECYGMSPKLYLTRLRLSYAKELLGGEYSIAEVAERAGFRDASHLSVIFCKYIGVPPSEFRRNLQGYQE